MTTFKKGYANDIGIDVCLDHEVIFRPYETKVIDIGFSLPTFQGIAIMMCARTSAARQGLIVNQCPIDPNYTGSVHIIAHNVSNDVVIFKAGEAFAQIYAFDIQPIPIKYTIKKNGLRNKNNFGSSDGGDNVIGD